MNSDNLVYMINQIARNFAAQGEAEAAAATARHIQDFWAPRMRAAILAGEFDGLSSIAAAAINRLNPPEISLG